MYYIQPSVAYRKTLQLIGNITTNSIFLDSNFNLCNCAGNSFTGIKPTAQTDHTSHGCLHHCAMDAPKMF